MQSFRTELEDPLVEKDILELEQKIHAYRSGTLAEDKFRSLRLTRGVYGQRQTGVQMVRIKLPFGKITPRQLERIADISDEYSNGKLHLTTRQDIQIHFVSLDRTPELWAKLEEDDITLREACGNTVRNITASAFAGIDLHEPFDVSPYADAFFRYFLRKPFGQELGRKIKIAFSSSDADTAYTFMHDIGFLPKVIIREGKLLRGFKVLIGGGLGAQPFLAQTAFEFLEEEKILPFTEALIRVFDRYGERSSRHKARLKYLVNKIGLEELLRLVQTESTALVEQTVFIDREAVPARPPQEIRAFTTFRVGNEKAYQLWLKSNVVEQKQEGYVAVNLKLSLGNLTSSTARELAKIIRELASEDIRITIGQGLLLRYVPKQALPALFKALHQLGLAEPGADSVADITACPGTDTCNLAISNSTGIAKVLEGLIEEEYPELLLQQDLKIKISGCMNSCGQHSLAQIGFHGSSFKHNNAVVPALQLLLGGGVLGNGQGRIADKIIKIPSKRAPQALREVLDDYKINSKAQESFNAYYERKGKEYFYQLLKQLSDPEKLTAEDYIDWNQTEAFKTEIGVGECAGVLIDLVSTLLFEVEEKLDAAQQAFEQAAYADSIYHSYSSIVSGAKALLLHKNVQVNTHQGVLNDFQQHFIESGEIQWGRDFAAFALQINQRPPDATFAANYLQEAREFYERLTLFKRTHEN